MKKSVDKILTAYFKDMPNMPDEQGLSKVLETVTQPTDVDSIYKINFIEFILNEALYIKKSIWVMQILLLGMCFAGLWYFNRDIWKMAWVSSILPLFMLGAMLEFSRPFSYNMCEMEFSTKYSLYQVMLAKIFIFGIINLVEISILFIYTGFKMESFSFILLIYMSLPFLITVFLCMFFTNRVHSRESGFMVVGIGLFVSVTTGGLAYYYPQVYRESMEIYWYITIICLSISIIIELIRILKACCNKLDGINEYTV